MGTVLRVLVIILLVLGGAALFFAIQLYGKRELLIGRTHMLEDHVRQVARTLEEKDPPDAVLPSTFVGKDTSPVTSQELENPDHSKFWDEYQFKLETPNLPTMVLDTEEMRRKIRQFYRMEMKDGKLVHAMDAVNEGQYAKSGPGTMAELLEQVLARAKNQQGILNKTRVELTKLRVELCSTILELNKLKQEARTDKKTIEEKQKKIDQLEEDIRGLKKKIDQLEEDKKALSAELAEAKQEIEKQKGAIEDLNKKIKEMTAENKRLNDIIRGQGPGIIKTGDQLPAAYTGGPGDKGKVVALDEKLKFVVVELSDAAMTELVGEQRDREMPKVEFMVRRPGLKSTTGEFVTRIKLRSVDRKKNLVVADIMIDWQQTPVNVNDVVCF